MALALRSTGTNCAPGDQVADELRAQQIQELGADRQPRSKHIKQQAAGHLQPLVDGEAAVEVRVVDVTLPAHCGARLLEVDAHHDQQIGGVGVGFGFQQAGVFHRLIVVVDRAGADDHQQPIVMAMQDARDCRAARFDQLFCRFRHRQLLVQQRGREQRAHARDAGVVDTGGVVSGVVVHRGHGRVARRVNDRAWR